MNEFNPNEKIFCPLLAAEANRVSQVIKVRDCFNAAQARAEYEEERLRGLYVEDIRFNKTAPFIVIEFGYYGTDCVHDKVVICFENGTWKVDDGCLGRRWLDMLIKSDQFQEKFSRALLGVM